MKVKERLKKVLSGIGAFLLTIPTKVFSVNENTASYVIEHMGPTEALYGVYRPYPRIVKIWSIAKTFVIPIVLFIGFIIYFKKAKCSMKEKVLLTIGIIVIIAILYFVVNKIIYEL